GHLGPRPPFLLSFKQPTGKEPTGGAPTGPGTGAPFGRRGCEPHAWGEAFLPRTRRALDGFLTREGRGTRSWRRAGLPGGRLLGFARTGPQFLQELSEVVAPAQRVEVGAILQRPGAVQPLADGEAQALDRLGPVAVGQGLAFRLGEACVLLRERHAARQQLRGQVGHLPAVRE